MKTPFAVAAWMVTLAAAFLAGRALSGDAPAPGETDTAKQGREEALDRRVEELTRMLQEEKARVARAAPSRERTRPAEASELNVISGIESPPPETAMVDTSAKFSMDGVTSGPDLSKKLMAYVNAQLDRGEDGYPAVMQALNTMWSNKDAMKELFQDESAMSRQLYPWIKMLVRRENETVGLTEFVFRTMAEKPEFFADTPDADVLELFTEGMAFLLPGAVPEERMAIFRAYAKKILDTPQDKQPKALASNRDEIERLLERLWREPITAEQALAKLEDASINAKEAARLVRALSPELRAKLDVTALVTRFLEKGDRDAVGLLASPPFDQVDRARLDREFLAAVARGTIDANLLSLYLRSTKRVAWADAKPLVDGALALGPKGEAAAFGLLAEPYFSRTAKPDKAYVEDAMSSHTVPPELATRLKSVYGIQ